MIPQPLRETGKRAHQKLMCLFSGGGVEGGAVAIHCGSGLKHLWGRSHVWLTFWDEAEFREREMGDGDWRGASHQNIPDSLGVWMPGVGVELWPEYVSLSALPNSLLLSLLVFKKGAVFTALWSLPLVTQLLSTTISCIWTLVKVSLLAAKRFWRKASKADWSAFPSNTQVGKGIGVGLGHDLGRLLLLCVVLGVFFFSGETATSFLTLDFHFAQCVLHTHSASVGYFHGTIRTFSWENHSVSYRRCFDV